MLSRAFLVDDAFEAFVGEAATFTRGGWRGVPGWASCSLRIVFFVTTGHDPFPMSTRE